MYKYKYLVSIPKFKRNMFQKPWFGLIPLGFLPIWLHFLLFQLDPFEGLESWHEQVAVEDRKIIGYLPLWGHFNQ